MKNSIRIATGIGILLLIPLMMTLLAVWHWKPGAFILAFILLLLGAILTRRLVVKKAMCHKTYRFAIVLSIAAVFLLIWMNAAVGGILGDDPANMMYFGVLLTGSLGALITQLEPRGMSLALFATAFATLLVPAIAWIIGAPAFANGVAAVFGLHAFFATMFAVSALLFKSAGSLTDR